MSNDIINEGYSINSQLFDYAKNDKIFIKKKYFHDLSNCAGSLILGHNSYIYKKSIGDYLKKNISVFAHPNIHAKNFSKTLKKFFPEFSKIVFCNSGSEAIIKSLRISRSLNKKKKIACVTGSWHGSVDKLLFYPDKKFRPLKMSDGLSDVDKNNIIFVPYNDLKKTKEILDKNKKLINCLIIEPIQASLPIKNVKSYLEYLEKFCKKNNCNLIFDEMITGVRVKKFSIQKRYNITPNITTIGKVIGGGMPIGVIGISKDTAQKIKRKKIFFGGTFSANSLSCYVGNETLKYLLKNKNIFKNINNISEYFETKLNNFLKSNKIDAKVYRFDSIIRIVFSKKNIDNRTQRDFFEKKNLIKIKNLRNFLLKKKIYYPSSGIIFLSSFIKKKNLDYIITNIMAGLKKFF